MRSLCFVAALSLPLLAQGAETAKPAAAAPARVIAPAPAFTAKQLAAPPTASWITNGGSLWNQRYSPLAAIDKDNVGNLKGVWRTHLESGIDRSSPDRASLFHDGVIYMVTGANDVFALDVDTGAILWRYDAHLDANRVKVCARWVARGVGLGEGKVFVGQLDAKLVALDQKTARCRGRSRRKTRSWATRSRARRSTTKGSSSPALPAAIWARAAASRRTTRRAASSSGPSIRFPRRGSRTSNGSWPKHNDAWKYGGAAHLADAGGGSGAGPALLLHRQRGARVQRRGARRRQSLHRVDPRARSEDG